MFLDARSRGLLCVPSACSKLSFPMQLSAGRRADARHSRSALLERIVRAWEMVCHGPSISQNQSWLGLGGASDCRAFFKKCHTSSHAILSVNFLESLASQGLCIPQISISCLLSEHVSLRFKARAGFWSSSFSLNFHMAVTIAVRCKIVCECAVSVIP
jgi:hypothetical protein